MTIGGWGGILLLINNEEGTKKEIDGKRPKAVEYLVVVTMY